MSKIAAQQEQIPTEPQLATSCFDFLLIEIVPLAQRMVERLVAKEQAVRDEYKRAQTFHKHDRNRASISSVHGVATQDEKTPVETDAASNTANSVPDTSGDTTTLAGAVDDEVREALFWRLDQMGYRVGQGLVEKFSANKPRPQVPLDAIKFICKDMWQLLFMKPIDNLKTNHRGVFVLTDNRFVPISRMSADRRRGAKGLEEANKRAQAFLYFPCGIIRGALSGFGVDVTVHAEVTEIPTATFQIKTKSNKT